MAQTQPEATVDSGIVHMWRTDGRLYAIAGFLVGLMAFPLINAINETGEFQTFLENLIPEAVGIFVTVAFIYYLDRRRDERNAEKALKEQLKMDAASISNEIAKNGVHQLWRRGWLHGDTGLLKGENLTSANMQDAVLMGANLQGVDLRTANLQGANLYQADLHEAIMELANLNNVILREADLHGANARTADMRGANLDFANLQGADLSGVSFEGALLRAANLQKTDLVAASLQGADLNHANLEGADLRGAEFDERTVLPDTYHWVKGADVRRFTDPTHPEFWQSPNWREGE